MKIKMDLQLARACGQDEGNRNMRKHGRKAWNEEDWKIACKTIDRLWGIHPEIMKEFVKK